MMRVSLTLVVLVLSVTTIFVNAQQTHTAHAPIASGTVAAHTGQDDAGIAALHSEAKRENSK